MPTAAPAGRPDLLLLELLLSRYEQVSKDAAAEELFEKREELEDRLEDLEVRALAKNADVKKDDDVVNHPSHYTSGKIEVLDYIEDQGLYKNSHLANVIKYVSRAGKKDPDLYIQDLKKALFYLKREITRAEAQSL